MTYRKLRMGMIGGGPGSFIGIVHYNAAVLDGQIELVCGTFSSDPGKSKITGESYFLPNNRIYRDYKEMIRREAALPEGDRMDLVCIVTPNHLHYEPAKLALEAGFHVVCDKPLTTETEHARELADLTEKTAKVFALTHPYIEYPLVKEARLMIREGKIGKIRKVVVEYPQGWLSTPLEKTDNKQAGWRSDPKQSGKCGAMADIGTHAFNLAETVTGLRVTELYAHLHRVVEGRKLDDDGNVLLHFENGANGLMFATQIAAGEENDVNFRIYGEKGSLEWHQHDPNRLLLKWLEKPAEVYRAGHDEYLSETAMHNTRLPFGHPEGLIEAFANLYKNVANCIRAGDQWKTLPEKDRDFATVHDGLRGMLFLDAVLDSSAKNVWVTI